MEPTDTKNKKKNRAFALTLGALLTVGAVYGIIKYIHSLHHIETDNAQIHADISPVVPRVPGYVLAVRVRDHQKVNQGDTLVILDDRELQIAVREAEAALAIAQNNLTVAKQNVNAAGAQALTSKAGIAAAEANIEAARVNVWRTTQDLERYTNLIKDHSVTRQQYEKALAAKQAAELELDVLVKQKEIARRKSKAAASQTRVSSGQIDVTKAIVEQRQAALQAAELRLSHAVITAPVTGQVSEVHAEPGQYLQPGQQLFSIVMNDEIWVIANFKETQLKNMQSGQEVEIKVDAFPSHPFRGEISSFSPATGASFALLPPDNATGNFVKVVQRVPVKITLQTGNDTFVSRLRVGMNAEVDVHIN